MARRNNTTGQIPIEGLEYIAPLELGEQYSFAHIAKPEYWGVEARALDQTDYEDMERMAPERLLPTLITYRRQPCSVAYRDEHNRPINVALTPTEYGLISRNAEKLGEASVNKTLAARPPRIEFGLDVEAAGRSGVYTLQNYVDKMDRYTTQSIELDIKLLNKFREYTEHPDLRRLRGDNFRLKVEWMREHIFGDTMIALRRQRDWQPEQEERAWKALDARLFLDRGNNRHIENWQKMLDFELTYYGHKWALFKSKTEEAKRYIKTHDKNTE